MFTAVGKANKIKPKIKYSLLWLLLKGVTSFGPISLSLPVQAIQLFEETLRADGNAVTNATALRFEPQTSRSIDEHVITGRYNEFDVQEFCHKTPIPPKV